MFEVGQRSHWIQTVSELSIHSPVLSSEEKENMLGHLKDKKRTRLSGAVLIIVAAVLWGTTGTSQALAPVESTPLTIGALRLLVGGGGLTLYALIKDRSF